MKGVQPTELYEKQWPRLSGLISGPRQSFSQISKLSRAKNDRLVTSCSPPWQHASPLVRGTSYAAHCGTLPSALANGTQPLAPSALLVAAPRCAM